jgi:DNA-binding SARP family transcriptional activator
VDRLALSFLGGFQARLQSGPRILVRTRKGEALLAYLACHPNESHPRGKLAALLWADAHEGSARHSLRQTLCILRASLPESAAAAICAEADSISLNAKSLVVDVVAFERLTREGTPAALEEAAALYRGDLLAGIPVDEPGFEEWLRVERERLRDHAIDVLVRLIALQRDAGRFELAVQTAHRLLMLEPSEEVIHRTLMRLYARLGRFGAVRRQYEHCVQALRRDLDVDPSDETKQLLAALTRRDSCRTESSTVTRTLTLR